MENRDNNAIFTQSAPVEASTSENRPLPGTDIVAALAPLPSKGIVYPTDSPLFGQSSVEIKPMTTREEDILTNRALLKKGTALTELVKSVIVDKRINPLDLISGDMNAVVVAIRITGYGAEYNVEVKCPKCEEKNNQTFDLSKMTLKTFGIKPVAEGVNEFAFVLPNSKKEVHFKYVTGADEEEFKLEMERRKKAFGSAQTEQNVTTQLLRSIVSINGITSRQEISKEISNMGAADSRALRKYIRDNEPGINTKQLIVCPHCEHEEEMDMPLGISFFWPDA